MGLKTLEWHRQQCQHTGRMGWVASIATHPTSGPRSRGGYRRFANVDILPDWVPRVKDKCYVQILNYWGAELESGWHDSVDAAILYVEALFALDED